MAWHKPDNVAGSAAPAILIGLFVAFGGLLFGYDTGTISGVIKTPWWLDQFATSLDPNPPAGNPTQKALTAAQTAQIVSILSAGTFVGALCAAPIADHLGRRKSLMISMGIFAFGIALQTASMGLPMFTAGRFIAGVGVGEVSVLVPLYQSEMAPKWVRGALVCAYQLAITAGLFIAAIVIYVSQSAQGPASFRIPIALQFVWAAILLFGLIVLPETPRYLIKRGLSDEAAKSLSRIRRLDITHPALIEEIAEIEANHAYELSLGPSTYRDIFVGSPHLGRRLMTGCGLFMLQQLSGCNFIFYYGNVFFSTQSPGSGFLFQVIFNVVNVVSTLPGIVLVESIGRRKLLMIGAAGMAVSQFIVASVGSLPPSTTNNGLFAFFICVFIFFFASSWGPVCWVVSSEIYPLKVRAKSMSVATSSNWLLNWLCAYATPYLLGSGAAGSGTLNMGPKIFYVWGACCAFGFVFVWTMVYETSKISLEQIDELYERVDHAWNSTQFQPSWSFQDIRQETENGFASGVNLVDREEARRRAGVTTSSSDGTGSETITESMNGTSSTGSTLTTQVTEEDKIIASMGAVDFSL